MRSHRGVFGDVHMAVSYSIDSARVVDVVWFLLLNSCLWRRHPGSPEADSVPSCGKIASSATCGDMFCD
jgi:hypothetical protein